MEAGVRRRLRGILALVLVATLAAGCTTTDDQQLQPVDRTGDWVPATDPVQLTCADGLTGPDLWVDEIKLTDNLGSGLLEQLNRLPRAVAVGIPAPTADWYFRKAPLFVAPGTSTVTLSVPEDGRQYLFWTSAEAWTDGSVDNVDSAWATSQIAVTGCATLTTSYFGGLLVEDPTRCFTLDIREEGQPPEEVTIRGDGSACE